MKIRQLTSLLGALALAVGLNAGAATVSLQPSAAIVPQTTAFTVDLMLSAADISGDHPGSVRGRVIIDFDPALISFDDGAADSFVLANGLSFLPLFPLTVESANGHETVTFGFQYAPDVSRVGTFKFTAIGAPQSIASIGLDDALIFGSFFNTLPTNQPFVPTFSGTSIQVSAVPLPATAWLLVTAFGIAGARARRARMLR